jgi:hypothetical protein
VDNFLFKINQRAKVSQRVQIRGFWFVGDISHVVMGLTLAQAPERYIF